MHYARFPEHLQGYRPIWTNAGALCAAEVDADGRIMLGAARVPCLSVDTQWLPYSVVEALLRLAQAGATIVLGRLPAEPGTLHHPDYGQTVAELARTVTVGDQAAFGSVAPEPLVALVEPENRGATVPEFWSRHARVDGRAVYRYVFAHPGSRRVRYRLHYGLARSLEPTDVKVRIAGPSEYFEHELHVGPGGSILLDVDDRAVTER